MRIGMRGHDFGRLCPQELARRIAEAGFCATQLAFTKAFPPPAEQYMTPEAIADIRAAFEARDIALPIMGCYVSASDRDPQRLADAKAAFARCLRASVRLGADCVGTETTHFTFPESEREAAYQRLLDFVKSAVAVAEQCGARVGIEPVSYHTLNTPEMTRRLLDDVGSDHLGVVLDLANLVTRETTAPQAQRKLLDRALSLFGDRILVLHVKDGVFGSEGKWENRPLGQGVMDWANLLPELRAHNDDLCALREDVWPGMAREECALLHRWIGE